MKIETERLVLREWNEGDIDDLVEGLNDFDTIKNMTAPFPYQIKDAKEFIDKNKKHKNDSYYFAIELKDTGKVIGGTNVCLVNGKVKGGIWINKDYQGKGYGTEAFDARAEFAFDIFDVAELENGFFDFNKKSLHMQEKLGYEIVGEKKNFSSALNQEVVEIVTKLTKESYLKNKNRNKCLNNGKTQVFS